MRQDCTSAREDKFVGMGKTARQPGWKGQLPGSSECRPCGETTIPHKLWGLWTRTSALLSSSFWEPSIKKQHRNRIKC